MEKFSYRASEVGAPLHGLDTMPAKLSPVISLSYHIPELVPFTASVMELPSRMTLR